MGNFSKFFLRIRNGNPIILCSLVRRSIALWRSYFVLVNVSMSIEDQVLRHLNLIMVRYSISQSILFYKNNDRVSWQLLIYLINRSMTDELLRWPYPILAFIFRHFGFLSPKDFSKVSWLSTILTFSIPDERYSRNASSALILISRFLLWILSFVYRNFIYLSIFILCYVFSLLLICFFPFNSTYHRVCN